MGQECKELLRNQQRLRLTCTITNCTQCIYLLSNHYDKVHSYRTNRALKEHGSKERLITSNEIIKHWEDVFRFNDQENLAVHATNIAETLDLLPYKTCCAELEDYNKVGMSFLGNENMKTCKQLREGGRRRLASPKVCEQTFASSALALGSLLLGFFVLRRCLRTRKPAPKSELFDVESQTWTSTD